MAINNALNTFILDEDNMASDSATALATQQSIKSYVDTYAPNAAQPNIIIGGNFTTNPWQRGTSVAGLTGVLQTYLADRFNWLADGAGVVTYSKSADSPTAVEAGVYSTSCLHIDVTTVDAAIGAAEYYCVQYIVEGYDISEAGFGLAGTRYVTLSFWHKHTKTGIYCVSLSNSTFPPDRSYIAEYTQDVSDTWEKATVTFPVDTTGTWQYTTGAGLAIYWSVAMGSDRQGAAGSWLAANDLSTVNQVNGMDDTANNFKLALVKLELGSKATPYPVENQSEILSKCQRYYQKTFPIGTAPAQNAGRAGAWEFFQNRTGAVATVSAPRLLMVPMRDVPTVVTYNPSAANDQIRNLDDGADFTATGVDATSISEESLGFAGTGNAGLIPGDLCSVHATFEAELY